MIEIYRTNPPYVINKSRVIRINDFEESTSLDRLKGTRSKIGLIKSDVLQFFLEDGSKISIRPSGTEPKIKFYFSVNTRLESAEKFEETYELLNERIEGIINDLKLK